MNETSLTTSNKKVFDPRIIEKESNIRLWSSASVILAKNGLRDGYRLVDSPFNSFVKDAQLRRGNLAFKYEYEELEIIRMCLKDKIFFGNNFISLKDGNEGWQRIKLRSYQENLLKRYDDNRWNIIMFPRQSGKTTTTIVEIVHFLTFNIDKDVVVIAQSDKTVNEILTKIKQAFQSLPFFIQPGFISFTKKGINLDNGCRLSIGIASESVVQGYSLDLVYIDEFAYIRSTLVDSFWSNIYPTMINNPKSRCIITSTPNGRNMFYSLWVNALNKNNSFVPYRIYWTDVPRSLSDEEFKKETIANMGEDGWLMGFECSFDIGLKNVFTTKRQQKLRIDQTSGEGNWKNENDSLGSLDKNLSFISKNIVKYDTEKDWFILSIDIGEGLLQDNSVIKINKMYWSDINKRLEYDQIGVFSSNDISEEDFALLLLNMLKNFDLTKIKVIVESNTYGKLFFHEIDTRYNYEKDYSWFSKNVFAKFWRESKNDYDYGLLWREDNKNIGVKSFATLIESDVLKTTHVETIEEYLNFGRQKNGTYKANYGHDDLVMADVTFSYYVKIQNIYAKEFLKEAEQDLKSLNNDTKDTREKEIVQQTDNNYYKVDERIFHVRDHNKSIIERSKTFNKKGFQIVEWNYDDEMSLKKPEEKDNIYSI